MQAVVFFEHAVNKYSEVTLLHVVIVLIKSFCVFWRLGGGCLFLQ